MAVNKEHREFYQLDMDSGWETPKGYPSGIKQKVLSGHLDMENRLNLRWQLLFNFTLKSTHYKWLSFIPKQLSYFVASFAV